MKEARQTAAIRRIHEKPNKHFFLQLYELKDNLYRFHLGFSQILLCLLIAQLFLLPCASIFSQTIVKQTNKNALSAESKIDWSTNNFFTTTSIDLIKSNIPLPSGKDTAENRIYMELPFLLKNKILSIVVDSSMQLSDIVLQNTISLEQLSKLIDDGKKSPGIFSNDLSSLEITHSISLLDINALLIKHTTPYSPQKPIERVSSRAYTGIIIDARGLLPVQGEYIKAEAVPCIFPKIWDESMELLYERNMVDSIVAKKQGIITYSSSNDESLYIDRIGKDPLRISARKIFGINRTDPVISRNDALKILSVPENIQLLKQGRIVILMDSDKLRYTVTAEEKDPSYYVVYQDVEKLFDTEMPENTTLDSTTKGIRISIQKLKFKPDSAELLSEEENRLDTIANLLKTAVKDNDYTIEVDGHTASVGKPEGEQLLSIERAKAIIAALTERGLPEELFTYHGYGGTMPVADNGTDEGRAQNRRVEITVVPKITYIRR